MFGISHLKVTACTKYMQFTIFLLHATVTDLYCRNCRCDPCYLCPTSVLDWY